MMYLIANILIFFIIIWPKIDIIHITGSNTGIRPDDIFIFILLVLNLINIKKNYYKITSNKTHFIWLIFLIWTIFITLAGSLHKTTDLRIGILHFGRLFQFYTVYLFAGTLVWEKKEVKKIFMTIIIATLIVIVYGLLQIYDITPYFSTLQSIYNSKTGNFTHVTDIKFSMVGVIMSTFGGHYDFGIFIVFVISFIIAAFITAKEEKWFKKQHIILIISGMIFLYLLISSLLYAGSRSAFLALLAALAIAGLQYAKILTLLSIGISSVLTYKFFQGKLGNLPGIIEVGKYRLNVDLSTVIRLNKWHKVLFNHSFYLLITGMGLASQGEAVDGYYIRIIGEAGIIGLIIFLLLILNILKKSYNSGFCREEWFEKIMGKGLFLATIALMVQGIFIDVFTSSKIMYLFWFTAGIITGMEKNEKPDSSEAMSLS